MLVALPGLSKQPTINTYANTLTQISILNARDTRFGWSSKLQENRSKNEAMPAKPLGESGRPLVYFKKPKFRVAAKRRPKVRRWRPMGQEEGRSGGLATARFVRHGSLLFFCEATPGLGHSGNRRPLRAHLPSVLLAFG